MRLLHRFKLLCERKKLVTAFFGVFTRPLPKAEVSVGS